MKTRQIIKCASAIVSILYGVIEVFDISKDLKNNHFSCKAEEASSQGTNSDEV